MMQATKVKDGGMLLVDLFNCPVKMVEHGGRAGPYGEVAASACHAESCGRLAAAGLHVTQG